MKEQLERRTDEELIREILSGSEDGTSAQRNVFFWRCFDRFEKNIRAVLQSHGIPYSVDEPYYNHVFDSLHETLFGHRQFTKIAGKFDPSRGLAFRDWFLGKVKRNRILDWLKSTNRKQGMTNRKWLLLKYPTSSLMEPMGRDGTRERMDTIAADSPEPDSPETDLEPCLRELEPGSRVLIKLLYWGISPLSEEELDTLAAAKETDKETIRSELSAYEQRFNETYLQDLDKAYLLHMDLGIRHFLLRQNEKKIFLKTEVLFTYNSIFKWRR